MMENIMTRIEFENMLKYIDPNNINIWTEVGTAIKSEFGDSGFDLWDQWLQKESNYNARISRNNWDYFKAEDIDPTILLNLAREGGYAPTNTADTYTVQSPLNIKGAIGHLAKRKAQEQKFKEKELRQETKKESNNIWLNAQEVGIHPYLLEKNITHPDVIGRLRQTIIANKNFLLVPIQDIQGNIHSLQYISTDGSQYFAEYSDIKGHFFLIGNQETATKKVIITEELATGSSLYEATQTPVIVTFNADNLLSVLKTLELNQFSDNYLVVFEYDTSISSIEKSLKIRAIRPDIQILMPSFNQTDTDLFLHLYGKLPSNFNDLHLVSGIEAVAEQIQNKRHHHQSELTSRTIQTIKQESLTSKHHENKHLYDNLIVQDLRLELNDDIDSETTSFEKKQSSPHRHVDIQFHIEVNPSKHQTKPERKPISE